MLTACLLYLINFLNILDKTTTNKKFSLQEQVRMVKSCINVKIPINDSKSTANDQKRDARQIGSAPKIENLRYFILFWYNRQLPDVNFAILSISD